MTPDDKSILRSEISRRESIKRGALAGGALLWSAPMIKVVNLADGVEPKSPTGGHDISYIALNVTKNGLNYVIKWEVDGNYWDPAPGSFPSCTGIFSPLGTKTSGSSLGFVASQPSSSGCITITVPSGAVVRSSASKGGPDCCAGPSGSGNLVFCPC
jgi:hypothetical protein